VGWGLYHEGIDISILSPTGRSVAVQHYRRIYPHNSFSSTDALDILIEVRLQFLRKSYSLNIEFISWIQVAGMYIARYIAQISETKHEKIE